MRTSVKSRIYIFVLFWLFLYIFTWFSRHGYFYENYVYLGFAIVSLPTFLYVYLGENDTSI